MNPSSDKNMNDNHSNGSGTEQGGEFEVEGSKHFCCFCCKSGEVGFIVKFPKSTFVIGEFVSPTLKIYNHSKRIIKSVICILIEETTWPIRTSSTAKGKTSKKEGESILAKVKIPGLPMSPGGSKVLQGNLFRIPNVLPSGKFTPSNASLKSSFTQNYFIQIKMQCSGYEQSYLKKKIPIKVDANPIFSTEFFSAVNSIVYSPQYPPAYGNDLARKISIASRASMHSRSSMHSRLYWIKDDG